MIYALLFLLDFYNNIVNFISFIAILGFLSIIVAVFTVTVNKTSYAVRKRQENPNFMGDEFDRTTLIFYDVGCITLKHLKKIITIIVLAVVLPNPSTVYVVTGIAAGNYLANSLKNNPIAQKVYLLAEKKIDNIVIEQLEKDSK